MRWLGLEADEGPFYQTERYERYREVLDEWLDTGKAYHCYCTREELDEMRARQMEKGEKTRYDGRCRNRSNPRDGVDPVVRFRNPVDGVVVVEDVVRGRVEFRNSELDDLIIARSNGTPTYNFTVVVDDHDMRITHVIRGDDHLNNTPRQMNMLAALGAATPVYAHLPMILGADGAKLSKRHGAVDIRDYRDQGYLADAMLNYLVRLGWSHGDQEVFTRDEMIALFDIADVNQSASSFNPEKLAWISQQHIIRQDRKQLGDLLTAQLIAAGVDIDRGPDPEDVADVYRERAKTLSEMVATCRYCYEDFAEFDAKAARKNLRPVILDALTSMKDALSSIDTWSADAIDSAIRGVAESSGLGLGKVGQPLRVAVTGGGVSPPIDQTVWLVGKERALERIGRAISFVEARAAGG